MIHLADRMEYIHSDIRGELYHEALRMQASGIDVLKLNTGNPAAFGFPLPDSIRNALVGREASAVPYCDFQGMKEAREAIRATTMYSITLDSSAEPAILPTGVMARTRPRMEIRTIR